MSRIYWDTMLFVYMLEADPRFGPRVRQIHREMTRRGDALCTSVFTVGEVLTGPRKKGRDDVAAELKDYFISDELELIPFTVGIAEEYSRIRADYSVLPADAIHLASAAQARSDLFLTNDRRLQRLNIPGISFIAGLEAKIL
ncbi:MAG TPA: PIN domain-containing protein [Acidobacteriaceae bacterium]